MDTLLIYLNGHGGDLYMKIKYLEIFFARHFSDFATDLFVSGKVKKLLTVSDSCSAYTLFSTMKQLRLGDLFDYEGIIDNQ